VVTPEAGVGECASARKREHTHTGEMEEAEADTIPQDEPTDGMVTPEAGAGESASAKKRKYTHKEREIMREAINAETKKQLTALGVGELTQKFVTTMNPTKQKIYVYLVRKGGAKRTQMTEELGMPLKTLETALQQMVKDGLISAPYSKRLDNYYALELDGQYVKREIRAQP